jgi:hypothetical protein
VSFNKFEREIIGSIASNTVFGIATFIDTFILTEQSYNNEEYSGPGYNQYVFSINLNEGIKIINDNCKLEKIKEFIYVVEFLNRKELISTYEVGPDDIKRNIYSLFTKDNGGFKHDTNLFHLTGYYLNKEIKPHPSLNNFINNNFLTEDEMRLSYERKAREKSEFWTRTIAIVSIAVNILLVLFQYYTKISP